MNLQRVAKLMREIGSLQLELADAIEQPEPKRKRQKKIRPPEVEPSQEAKDRAQRALRKAGYAA